MVGGQISLESFNSSLFLKLPYTIIPSQDTFLKHILYNRMANNENIFFHRAVEKPSITLKAGKY